MASMRDFLLQTTPGRWVAGSAIGLTIFGTVSGSSTSVSENTGKPASDSGIYLTVDGRPADNNTPIVTQNYGPTALPELLQEATQGLTQAAGGTKLSAIELGITGNVASSDLPDVVKTFSGLSKALDIKLSDPFTLTEQQKIALSAVAAEFPDGIEMYQTDGQDVRFQTDRVASGSPSLTVETDNSAEGGRKIVITSVPVNPIDPVTSFTNLLNDTVDTVTVTGVNGPIPESVARLLPDSFGNILKPGRSEVDLNNVQGAPFSEDPLYGVSVKVNGVKLPDHKLESNPSDLSLSLVSQQRTSYALGNTSNNLAIGAIPTFVQINASEPEQALSQIKAAVKQQNDTVGIIPTLLFAGDGNTNSTALSEPAPSTDKTHHLVHVPEVDSAFREMSITSILKTLEDLQAENGGHPIAKNIVFTDCDLAKELDGKTAKAFSDAARKLGADITMATSIDFFDGISPGKAHYITFKPNGHVTVPLISDSNGYQVACTLSNQCEDIAKNEEWIEKYFKKDPSPKEQANAISGSPSQSSGVPPHKEQRFTVSDTGEISGSLTVPSSGIKITVSGTSRSS